MRTIRVNDIDVHHEVTDFTDPWREPETVLLHHGFARNLRFWYQWVPLLCRDYRVVTLDARGCGETTKPPEGHKYSLDELVSDAVGLLDALGIGRVHWAAEASGGIVGIATALAHPGRIASLTLCNTPFRLPKATNDLFVADEVREHGVGYWGRKTLFNRIDTSKVPEGWVEWSLAELDRTPPHTAIGLHELFAQGDLWPRLPEVKAPTLILVGESSDIARKDEMEQMSRRIPGARLVVFEGYGQGVAFMVPERCVAEMKKFLGALRGAARQKTEPDGPRSGRAGL